MATEQYLTQAAFQNQHFEDADADTDTGKNWKSSNAETDVDSSGGFDCSICLDSVQDPVVTLCGHLYCWPCIYKWIQQQSVSAELPLDQNPQCPVCKADVSEKTLIPLYGRSQSKAPLDSAIPCRPKGPPCGVHASSQQPAQQHPGSYDYDTSALASASAISLAGSNTFHPVISMFGGMMCTGLFGNSESFYTHPNSYSVAATSSASARRQARKVDRSLSRLSFFLLCCLVVCLVLF